MGVRGQGLTASSRVSCSAKWVSEVHQDIRGVSRGIAGEGQGS